jgi:hypothetical protein
MFKSRLGESPVTEYLSVTHKPGASFLSPAFCRHVGKVYLWFSTFEGMHETFPRCMLFTL